MVVQVNGVPVQFQDERADGWCVRQDGDGMWQVVWSQRGKPVFFVKLTEAIGETPEARLVRGTMVADTLRRLYGRQGPVGV